MPSQTSLENRHRNLENMIRVELKRPAPDSIKVKELKKEKLRIKDQILGMF